MAKIPMVTTMDDILLGPGFHGHHLLEYLLLVFQEVERLKNLFCVLFVPALVCFLFLQYLEHLLFTYSKMVSQILRKEATETATFAT